MRRTALVLALALLTGCATLEPIQQQLNADVYCSLWATPDRSNGWFARCLVAFY